jgi:hypothetical protein
LKFAFAELIFLMLRIAEKPAGLLLSRRWFDRLYRFFRLGDFLRIVHGEQQELAKRVTPVIALPG